MYVRSLCSCCSLKFLLMWFCSESCVRVNVEVVRGVCGRVLGFVRLPKWDEEVLVVEFVVVNMCVPRAHFCKHAKPAPLIHGALPNTHTPTLAETHTNRAPSILSSLLPVHNTRTRLYTPRAQPHARRTHHDRHPQRHSQTPNATITDTHNTIHTHNNTRHTTQDTQHKTYTHYREKSTQRNHTTKQKNKHPKHGRKTYHTQTKPNNTQTLKSTRTHPPTQTDTTRKHANTLTQYTQHANTSTRAQGTRRRTNTTPPLKYNIQLNQRATRDGA